ncbi:MAG: hypothetical protein ABIG95_06520 [Candidatus Woesearchaeota archaeon]
MNSAKVSSLIENADISISSAEIISKTIDQAALEWQTVFINYYEALRMLTEALLIFHKVKISNHKCLFAYLCVNYSQLDWNFLDEFRRKRNGANYYGEKITYKLWIESECIIKYHISCLKKILLQKG